MDPTAEEESCGAASIVISVNEHSKVTAIFKVGGGSFHQQTLKDTVKVILNDFYSSFLFFKLLCVVIIKQYEFLKISCDLKCFGYS